MVFDPKISQDRPPPRTEATRVGLSVDTAKLIRLFGAQNYTASLTDIVVRELVQNAFDAIRGAYAAHSLGQGQGRIHVAFDPDTRRLSVKDNGIGMEPQTLTDVFLRIGGTLKNNLTPDLCSGGFGIAKLAFLFAGEKLVVRSVSRGLESLLETSGEELLACRARLQTQRTASSNGTFIEIQFPKQIEVSNGNQKPLAFPQRIAAIKALTFPLIGPVTIHAQRQNDAPECLPLGSHFDHKQFPHIASLYAPWGDVDLYMATQPYRYGYGKLSVLSAGLFQFQKSIGRDLPDVICNVKPKVAAADPAYPFNKTREDWNAAQLQETACIMNVVQLLTTAKRRTCLLQEFANAKVVTRFNDTYSFSSLIAGAAKGSAFATEMTPHFILNDKGLHYKGSYLYKRSPTGLHQTQAYTDLLSDYCFHLSTNKPLVHNLLTIDPVCVAAQKMGQPVSKIHCVLGEMAYLVHDFMHKAFEMPGYGLPDTPTPFFGLIFKKDLFGNNLQIPYNAAFINPAMIEGKTPKAWAFGWLETMAHETCHWNHRQHNEPFVSALSHFPSTLEDAHPGLYLQTLSRLTSLATAHAPLFKTLHDVLTAPTTDNQTSPALTNQSCVRKLTP